MFNSEKLTADDRMPYHYLKEQEMSVPSYRITTFGKLSKIGSRIVTTSQSFPHLM